MKSSSLCEKTNIDLEVKNTRNPFEQTRDKSLDKLSFLYGS